jgi:hypothetical protein
MIWACGLPQLSCPLLPAGSDHTLGNLQAVTPMAVISDDEFIERIRDRHRKIRKHALLAVVAIVATALGSIYTAALAWREWHSLAKALDPTMEPFWLGVKLGALAGSQFALLVIVWSHGLVTLYFGFSGGERTQRLLLQRHDALLELTVGRRH